MSTLIFWDIYFKILYRLRVPVRLSEGIHAQVTSQGGGGPSPQGEGPGGPRPRVKARPRPRVKAPSFFEGLVAVVLPAGGRPADQLVVVLAGPGEFAVRAAEHRVAEVVVCQRKGF